MRRFKNRKQIYEMKQLQNESFFLSRFLPDFGPARRHPSLLPHRRRFLLPLLRRRLHSRRPSPQPLPRLAA